MDKHLLASKTFWANILAAIIPVVATLFPSFGPQLAQILSQNTEVYIGLIGALNIALRLISSGKVYLK